MNIQQALIFATSRFQAINIKSPNLDARILLQYSLNRSAEYLLSKYEEILIESVQVTFKNFVERRINLEPIAYIIERKEFYNYEFIVNNKVLIPRGDSEILLDAILNNITSDLGSTIEILELGTGCGCIAISLLLEIANSYVVATDISQDAILITKTNALKYKVNNKIKIIMSNWFEHLQERQFDFIISNPPYISVEEISCMARETINYEPHLALFANNNGLESYYFIAKDAKRFLKKNGKLLVEIGFNQVKSVSKIFYDYGYTIHQIYKDIAGHERVLLITKQNTN